MKNILMEKSLLAIFSLTLFVALSSDAKAETQVRIQWKKECVCNNSVIKLADVANIEIEPANPVAEHQLRQISVALRPARAMMLRTEELRHQLSLRGYTTREWQFSGPRQIRFGSQHSRTRQGTQTASYSSNGSSDSVQTSLNQVLESYLLKQVDAERDWKVSVKLNSDQYHWLMLPGATYEVQPFQPAKLGKTQVILDVNYPHGTRSLAIDTFIEADQMVVRLVRDVEKGDIFREDDFELRPIAANSINTAQYETDIEAAVGNGAAQRLTAGGFLKANSIEKPLMVQKRQEVTAKARAGNWVVSCQVVALQDGAEGEVVLVETLEGKERFTAIVRGFGVVEKMAEIDFIRNNSQGANR